jgi:hypothetical protein
MKKDLVILDTSKEIDLYLNKRQAFIAKVNTICVEGKDYHIIKGKKSLAKGGAEKIASIFKWSAKFEKDSDSLDMLGVKPGLVAFRCSLSLLGKFVGEGRGAASLAGNAGDPNKTLKMAQKSAFIDAVLRASGLSDFYTQDLEDMPKNQIEAPGTTRKNFNEPIVVPETPQTEPTSEEDKFSIIITKCNAIKDLKTAQIYQERLEKNDKIPDTQKKMIMGIIKSKLKQYA